MATSDDAIYHLAFQEEQETAQELVTRFDVNVTSIAGYFASEDSTHHLVMATSDCLLICQPATDPGAPIRFLWHVSLSGILS
ncbi:hypothetical protein [Dictyobacter kobayashii]|uniref:hypothetical protein n=1 Tax=Dictyobacter kobayashii TaxID=2014872 RepID=UPI000F823009|nr:hypothetical protein [Dictyobacter kobayashii]